MTPEEENLQQARLYGTLTESDTDPDGLARDEMGSCMAVNISPLCSRPAHRHWEWWSESGRLVCGVCHPPPHSDPRWLVTGGPVGSLCDLAALGATYEPAKKKAPVDPASRRSRHGASVDQGSVFSS